MNLNYIVLLENDESVLNLMEAILLDEGYSVISSRHEIPIQGMNQLPSLILLDHWFSGQPGTEIFQELKTNPHTSTIPMILTSTDYRIKDIASCCQADSYIPKPFDIQDLLDQVKRFVI
jgi:two-component system response regulator VicR